MKWNPDGSVTLEMRPCFRCNGSKQQYGQKPCPKCKGAGKTKGGLGKGNCRTCYGFKTQPDWDNLVPCKSCNATGEQPESTTDYMPRDWFGRFDFRVFRSNRPQTFNEEHIGLGYVFTCSDYGRHQKMSDAELIASVKDKGSSDQLCKVYNEKKGRMATFIGIHCNDNGYSVVAHHE